MTKGENRQQCPMTGVNLFANLDLLQGEAGGNANLAAKAQAAMVAANTAKRRREEDVESDGESVNSHSINMKTRVYKSGLGVKSGQRVRYQIEWAHHWLGKEFEANPVAFNQMRLGQYLMGEADIILNCAKPEEIRARLRLMCRIGYWQTKNDWIAARNVYAAIMRGLETGREDWNFDIRDYEDMLGTSVARQGGVVKDEILVKKPREVFFCGPYQRGECDVDSLHYATIGADGSQNWFIISAPHACSRKARRLHIQMGDQDALDQKYD